MEGFFEHYFIKLIFFILVVIPITLILKKILKKPFAETLDIVEKNLGKYIMTILCVFVVATVVWVEKGEVFIKWLKSIF
jgi:SNF family Na+-dependent transporter